MARTPQDSVAAVLRRAPLANALRQQAWEAVHAAQSFDELRSSLAQLPLPQQVRADLWDVKRRALAHSEAKMFPRESKYGRDGAQLPDRTMPSQREAGAHSGDVSAFIAEHFRHFNAATLHDAAEAYNAHLAKDGKMLVSLAGAMSTAELGRSLAPMIRQHKVHAISCTGANLEESLFDLIAHDEYERFPDYTELTPTDDAALATRNINRVTDTGIPEKTAMTPIEIAVRARLHHAAAAQERIFPHEVLYDLIDKGTLETHYQGDPAKCWLVAAAEADLPIVIGGWGDSTLGNVFAADCLAGTFEPTLIKGDTEYMMDLARWYEATSATHPMGFFQIGGGIAGDFPICVVPLLAQDAGKPDTKKWSYFCQVTDAHDSYGGYSGARPTEKNSWGKISPNTPTFDLHSDATIVVPLIFAYVLGL